MLAQLLSSKPKSRLVNHFLAHPDRSFSITELKVSTKTPERFLVKTVRELTKIGFIITIVKDRNRYFQIDKHFALYPELVSLLRKIKKLPVDLLVREASKVGDCKFIALTGVFAGHPRIETDALFVGKVSQKRLANFLKMAERFAERQVTYTVFTPAEFEYRKIMNDRFVKNIVENDPVVIVDKFKNKSVLKIYKR